MFGSPGSGPDHTINGNGGDDVIYGDYDYLIQGNLPGGAALTDDAGPWNQAEHPDLNGWGFPQTAVVIQKPVNDFTVKYRIDVTAPNALLILDVDYGGPGSHSNVQVYA